jgi:hypothetical protein
MRQFLSALAVAVMAGTVTLAGCSSNAQAQAGGPGGDAASTPSPARAAMEKLRDDTKAAVMGDLSADHRAQVQKIADSVNAGTDTDLGGAMKQVDAVLSPAEAKAVLAERDKMTTAMAALRAQYASSGAGGQGGGRRPGGAMMKSNDPGRFVLMVNLSRERMRALRAAQQGHPSGN